MLLSLLSILRRTILISMKPENLSLQNHYLIAMPALADFNFNRAVVYICAHNEEGAMGIVISRPLLDIKLGEVLSQLNIESDKSDLINLPVYLGGPVQPERGFIIHRLNQSWQSTLVTSKQLGVTSSQDILFAMVEGSGPEEFMVTLGYSGWSAGQLEQEVGDNLWLTVPAEPEILFDTPVDKRWEQAAATIGVDISHLSSDSGHA